MRSSVLSRRLAWRAEGPGSASRAAAAGTRARRRRNCGSCWAAGRRAARNSGRSACAAGGRGGREIGRPGVSAASRARLATSSCPSSRRPFRVDPPVRRSLHCWSEGLPRFRFRPTLSRLPAGRVSPASVGAVGWRVCLLHRAVSRSILPVARLLFSPLLRACSPRSAAVKELSAAPALCIRGLYSFKGGGNR